MKNLERGFRIAKRTGLQRALFILILLPVGGNVFAQGVGVDYLEECCAKLISYQDRSVLRLTYREVERRLYHSPRPWMTWDTPKHGEIVLGHNLIIQHDTVTTERGEFVTTTQIRPGELLRRNYRGEELSAATATDLDHKWLRSFRYSPAPLLERTRGEASDVDMTTREGYALYRLRVGEDDLLLAIRTADSLLEEVTRQWYDGMRGDMIEIVTYGGFDNMGGLSIPREISIESTKGVREEIEIVSASMSTSPDLPLMRPEGYSLEQAEVDEPDVRVENLTEHLHLVNYVHTESRSILVEFRDYMAVIDVPFDSRNGELLLRAAAEIAPDKPVRYFASGHHHPWYLGGLRPFVHNGTTLLCTPANVDYVSYLATASHSLQPDVLHRDPRPVKMEMIDSVLTITDGAYEMRVIHIGMRSAHTEDYLLFYFPDDKVVIHGDLAWVPLDDKPRKRSDREDGLLNAIREFELDVETIVQTWPVSDRHRVKSIYTVEELEN